ncbi:Farnesyl pyrophosphate synthase like protein [Verticillium longisporum]|nr:Farnesyl pyrophosphate synthase like protein [Verticillium longisporum]
MAQKTTLKEFEAVFPKLEAVLVEHAQKYKLPAEELAWYKKSLEINTLGGKCNRGMSVPDSVSLLLEKPLTEEQYFEAATLGWMTELLQAFFLVSDDIMDSSITRRGKPCWYRHEGVGMVAINDAFMLEAAIYTLLKKFFRSHPSYVDLIELFHDVTFETEMGQLCDLLTAPEDKVNLDNFSMDKYSFIVIYKTAYYSFYLPVALALHCLNIATPNNLKQAEAILIPLGEYFQKDKAKEAVVKKLYDDLKLKDRYEAFEEKRAAEIRDMINNIDESEGLKKTVFDAFLAKIYKRTK